MYRITEYRNTILIYQYINDHITSCNMMSYCNDIDCRVSQRLAKVAGNDKCADCGDASKYSIV